MLLSPSYKKSATYRDISFLLATRYAISATIWLFHVCTEPLLPFTRLAALRWWLIAWLLLMPRDIFSGTIDIRLIPGTITSCSPWQYDMAWWLLSRFRSLHLALQEVPLVERRKGLQAVRKRRAPLYRLPAAAGRHLFWGFSFRACFDIISCARYYISRSPALQRYLFIFDGAELAMIFWASSAVQNWDGEEMSW